MKILVVMPLAEQRGGGEVTLVHLLRSHPPNVHFTVALLEDGPLVAEFAARGHDVVVVRAGRLRQIRRLLACVLRLRRIARRSDVVLSWMPKAHIYGGPAAFLARRPAVWYQHGMPPQSWLDRLVTLIPAAGVLTVSRAGMDAQAGIWPQRAVRLVYPGTDLDRFDPAQLPDQNSLRLKLQLPLHTPLIGIVARLQRQKGIHLTVQAMPIILKKHPNAQLVIVGGTHNLEPGYAATLRDLVVALDLADHVHLVGLQRNVAEWMHAMDVVVMPSYDEAFGIAVVEAMALGKPVVASDSGGLTEIITSGRDGLMFKTGDVRSLAEVVLRVLGDPKFARELGGAARVRAHAFSAARFAESVVATTAALTATSRRQA